MIINIPRVEAKGKFSVMNASIWTEKFFFLIFLFLTIHFKKPFAEFLGYLKLSQTENCKIDIEI